MGWTLPTGWPFGCAGHRLKREAHTSSAWAPRLPTAAIGLSHSGQHAKISVWGIFTGKRLGVHLYQCAMPMAIANTYGYTLWCVEGYFDKFQSRS